MRRVGAPPYENRTTSSENRSPRGTICEVQRVQNPAGRTLLGALDTAGDRVMKRGLGSGGSVWLLNIRHPGIPQAAA
jgi:hypothetical protein